MRGWGASMTMYPVRPGGAGPNGAGLATAPDGAETGAVGGLFGARHPTGLRTGHGRVR